MGEGEAHSHSAFIRVFELSKEKAAERDSSLEKKRKWKSEKLKEKIYSEMTPAANMDTFSPKFDAFRRDLKNIRRSSVKVD